MYELKEPKTDNLKQGIVAQRLNSSSSFDSAQTLEITSVENGVDLPVKGGILAEDDLGGSCGWFCFRPQFLQRLRSIKGYLVFICIAALIQGVLVNGFVNVFISTLERRYQLSSTESGIIIGSYDIASFVTVLPISYFGGRPGANKPRWVAAGMLVMGIGSLIFALPQFTAGRYVASQTETSAPSTCPVPAANDSCSEEDGVLVGSLNNYKYVFIFAQLLHGAGAVPLFTLAVTFIDDNVSNKMQPLYTGFYYMINTLGPAIGFVGGGQLLRIYTDFIWISAAEIGITAESNVWVGAWWLGFVITGFAGIAVAIPLFAFPGELPGTRAMAIRKEKEARERKKKKQVENVEPVGDEEDDEDSEQVQKMSAAESLRDLPQAIKDLLTNPTFIFLCLAMAGEAFVVAGYGGFLPKAVESQFGVPASQSALIVGVVIVPAGVIGTVLGGYVIKRLRLRCSGTLLLCIIVGLIQTAFTLCFLVYCPEPNFAGINFAYGSLSEESQFNVTDTCNTDCGCSLDVFDPVCGVDNIMYYSPCFAGCSESSGSGGLTVFNNCSCIDAPPATISIQGKNMTLTASRLKCKTGCSNLNLFIGLLFCFLFFLFMLTMPAMSAVLRCVQSKRRSFALGVQTLVYRLLGSIPGPIVFGSLIDGSCRLWGKSCDGSGSCNFYDNLAFSRAMMWLGLITCGFSLGAITIAYLAYKRPVRAKKARQTTRTQNTDEIQGGCNNLGFVNEST